MASHFTKEQLSLQEQKEQEIQEFFGAIGDIKTTSHLLPKEYEYDKVYKEIITRVPNLIYTDVYLVSSLVSLVLDFKYYNELLSRYKKENNVDAYLAIAKVKNATSSAILSALKTLCLTPNSRKDIDIIFTSTSDDEEEKESWE